MDLLAPKGAWGQINAPQFQCSLLKFLITSYQSCLGQQVRFSWLFGNSGVMAKKVSEKFERLWNLETFELPLWLFECFFGNMDFLTLHLWNLWNFCHWNAGNALCLLLFTTIAPEVFRFFMVFPWLSCAGFHVLLGFFYKKYACAGIPPVNFSVEISPIIVIFLLYPWWKTIGNVSINNYLFVLLMSVHAWYVMEMNFFLFCRSEIIIWWAFSLTTKVLQRCMHLDHVRHMKDQYVNVGVNDYVFEVSRTTTSHAC